MAVALSAPNRARLVMLSIVLALVFAAAARVRAADPVDLNSAPAAALMTLPGVGPKRAEDILRYRLVHGFRRPEDLMRIKGIGRRTFLKLRPLVQVLPRRVVPEPSPPRDRAGAS